MANTYYHCEIKKILGLHQGKLYFFP